jgi:hypothetical protein
LPLVRQKLIADIDDRYAVFRITQFTIRVQIFTFALVFFSGRRPVFSVAEGATSAKDLLAQSPRWRNVRERKSGSGFIQIADLKDRSDVLDLAVMAFTIGYTIWVGIAVPGIVTTRD